MLIPSILTKCFLAQKALKYIVINHYCKAAEEHIQTWLPYLNHQCLPEVQSAIGKPPTRRLGTVKASKMVKPPLLLITYGDNLVAMARTETM